MKKIIIYWSRRDFRLNDNPALFYALKESEKLKAAFLPIFIFENYMLKAETDFQFGYSSRYFLKEAVPEFASQFKQFLNIKGRAAESLIKISKIFDIEIFVNEDIYIDFFKQIQKIKNAGISIKIFKDQMTINPETKTLSGNNYSIFTPFKKALWNDFLKAELVSEINKKDLFKVKSLNLEEINILKKHLDFLSLEKEEIWKSFSHKREFLIYDYKTKKKHILNINDFIKNPPDLSIWYFTEKDAKKRLNYFIKNLLVNYKENRDSLENDLKNYTSRLSLALTWGLISSRIIKNEIQKNFKEDFLNINWNDKNINKERGSVLSFISELIWREFYKYLMYHNPELMYAEFQDKFKNKIKWESGSIALDRFTKWISGETGYKVVDAAMMQISSTGWMHNRSRMIVSSVLTKNLGIDWRWGQEYFRAMLIDLDEASNNGGWQWGASVGADPKPIRIFNPYLQAKNYDKENKYQKKWLGEKYYLENLPIIDHKEARGLAIKRYQLNKVKLNK